MTKKIIYWKNGPEVFLAAMKELRVGGRRPSDSDLKWAMDSGRGAAAVMWLLEEVFELRRKVERLEAEVERQRVGSPDMSGFRKAAGLEK